jgi:hypothetical protein
MVLLLAFILLCSLLGLSIEASPAAQPQPPSFASTRQAIALAAKDCTVDSFRNVSSFILKEYQVETLTAATDGGPAGGTTQTRATLSVENPGTGDTYRLYRIPVSVTGGVWSVCRPGSEAPLPEQLVYCQYLIERRSHRIGFRFQWNCDGDPEQRYALLKCAENTICAD